MPGALALAAATPALMPGWISRPSAMPISTAMKAVRANQSNVCQTSVAALESCRRLLIEATIADPEFVQFPPTAIDVGLDPAPLATEALRGEGARLINQAGEAFMARYEPAGDLASRDLVARAMVRESLRTGAPVYLSLAHLDAAFVRGRFPTIAEDL